MITISKTSVFNIENALRGMRNPLNSWEKSDSFYDANGNYIIGEADLSLAKKLRAAGSDDRKFMRQIFVSVDISAPLYWWKEYDTYKVGTVANSTSTMHKIHAKKFDRDDFAHDKLDDAGHAALDAVIAYLEDERTAYLAAKNKDNWYHMIQMLPSSFLQLRTCTMDYENLVNMYRARKNHKLDEWRVFCAWVETLPYSELII